ncbi:DEAD/DEAH box helicase [Salibacteraceae bacterium]|nr:DEAD/DEAH box helicase [Salibacteraceae bacterium]MDB9725705.1 DEAD/DEAH box helicase [Salibacteraceae bacterium]MDC1203921.1 DEAD/DEAH box helicase [Salibacteraceae bacterium]
MTFAELGLSPELNKVIAELGYENPTPIQEQSIPKLLTESTDFIGLAQTGTGKTAAFGLPLLHLIDATNANTQALIVAPTRELANQIAEQIAIFAKYIDGLRTAVVYGGGANISGQIRELKRKPQIIIATPGRLLDLIGRKAINLSTVDYVVLDEADEMLNMGFKEDIDKILEFTPDTKLTWLFSATMPKDIRRIVKEYMTDPFEVQVSTGTEVNKNIEHLYAQVKSSDKMDALKRFLDQDPDMRGVIFCRTKIDTQKVAEKLAKDDYRVEPMHGDMTQTMRERVMRRFKDHELQVLVATDVAARGIDVDNLTHVIHYSLPDSREYYTHRSGRTARAGKKGISLALVNSREAGTLKQYTDRLKITFEKIPVPSVKDVQMNRMRGWFKSIADTEPSTHLSEEMLDAAYEVWEGLDIDMLIEKLVSHELNKLNYSQDHADLNDTSRPGRGNDRDRDRGRGRDRDRGRGDRDRAPRSSDRRDSGRGDRRGDRSDRGARENRKPQTTSGDDVTFFINLGRKDGMNESELRNYLSEKTGISSKDVGDIRLRNLNAYFDIDKKHSGKMSSSFTDQEYNGRELRVNRDSSGN